MITPCYVLNKQELEKNIMDMKNALSAHFEKWIIGYSFKTNSLRYVVEFMKNENCFGEVVSYQEYQLAKHLGYENIIYNGPMKSKETFFEALDNQYIVNVETNRELEWFKQYQKHAKIGVRVNFDLEAYCPGESQCGAEGGRFGICYENGELARVFSELNAVNHCQVNGLHFHISTKTRSVGVYRAIAKMAVKIIEEFNLNLEYIDVGGGFFGGLPGKPSFSEYFSTIKEELGRYSNLTLIVEPGASLIASPFTYVTSVIDVKDTAYNRFVVLDGSRNDVDPQFKKTGYLYELQTNSSTIHPRQVIGGYTCMESDRLFTLENGKELQVGDIIQFNKVGSYTMCLAPNFIKYSPRVYLLENKQLTEIKKEWSVEEYIAGAKGYEK